MVRPVIWDFRVAKCKMKNLLLCILATGKAFSQVDSRNDTLKKYREAHAPVIAAKDAYKYIGKMVVLKDSLYSGKVINDSTVCEMGEKANTPRLKLIYIREVRFRSDENRFFPTFQRYRLTI
jgi:hypothetical protein